MLALINAALAQENAESARAQWDAVSDQLLNQFPKLADYLDDAKVAVLAFIDLPKVDIKQLASTNPLERLNAEIKRRTDVAGIFRNDPTIIRLVGALLLEQDDE